MKPLLDVLVILDALEKEGSFAAASARLFKTPSALSYTIHRLESDLNSQLLDRSGHRAVLTDAEVELLLRDRGPEDAPIRSYAQLAKKYRVSKSCVRDICTGRRRGQRGMIVERPEPKKAQQDMVELRVRVPLKWRAIIRRNGVPWLLDVLATHTTKARNGAEIER